MHQVRGVAKQKGAGKLAEREEQLAKERENKLGLQRKKLVNKMSLKRTQKNKTKR